MADLEEYATALRFRDVLNNLVESVVEATRPKYRYATVKSIDRSTSRATVRYPGDSADVTVNMGGMQPMKIGQTVRIDGIAGDRFISDVMGPVYTRALNYNLIENGTFESDAGGVMPAGWQGGWTTAGNSITVDAAPPAGYARTGTKSVKLVMPIASSVARLGSANVVPVTPGDRIRMVAYGRSNVNYPSQTLQLSMLTAPTAAGADFFGSGVTTQASASLPVYSAGYYPYETYFTVPNGHYFARFYYSGQIPAASAGTLWLDDLSVRVMADSQPFIPDTLLIFDTISGASLPLAGSVAWMNATSYYFVGGWYTIRTFTSLTTPGNAAGFWSVYLDGTPIIQSRWHTLGTTVDSTNAEVNVFISPGVHTLAGDGSVDAGSAGSALIHHQGLSYNRFSPA